MGERLFGLKDKKKSIVQLNKILNLKKLRYKNSGKLGHYEKTKQQQQV